MSTQVRLPTTFRWRVALGMACFVGGGAVVGLGLMSLALAPMSVDDAMSGLDADASTCAAGIRAVAELLLPNVLVGVVVLGASLLLVRGRWRGVGVLEGLLGGLVGGVALMVVLWLGTGLVVSLLWPPETF